MTNQINRQVHSQINWQKVDNLLPAIIQDSITGTVLMLGYMNRAALEKTINTGKVWFYSRSKQRLWMKGEVSKNILTVNNIALDCDNDTILIQAEPAGPTCHTGEVSCFDVAALDIFDHDIFSNLYSIIQQRQRDLPNNSYTAQLLQSGISAISAKVAEESAEVIQAAQSETTQRVIEEACDVLYHLFVLCAARGVQINQLRDELNRRRQ